MPLQATSGAASYDAFGGGVAAVPQYIEECFSTWLYAGTSNTQTITNGIDLAGKGGLVWTKMRNTGAFGNSDHWLFDTARGVEKKISTNTTDPQSATSGALEQFNSNGYQLGYTGGGFYEINYTGNTYASWTFRKQPKFFDVVTFTQSGTSGWQTVSHTLGSVPGCIIFKNTTTGSTSWPVYHRYDATKKLSLDTTDAANTETIVQNLTSTSFEVSITNIGNNSGDVFVAYLFAHNAGGFGLSGNENVISCGSFTASGSGGDVNLGYEPQWVMIKRTDSTGSWRMLDIMRGYDNSDTDAVLLANSSSAETNSQVGTPFANGFTEFLSAGTYIYIAIRRGPMRTPTTGTSVFAPVAATGGGTVTTNFPVDLTLSRKRGVTYNTIDVDRLRGSTQYLLTTTTGAEVNNGSAIFSFDNNTGYADNQYASGENPVYWNFRRAPGFFDEVCYTGTGSARTVTHNLTVAPELWIIKRRSGTGGWITGGTVLTSATNSWLRVDATSAVSSITNFFTNPTSTTFGFGSGAPSDTSINDSSSTYVAYLFATCPGVSKVGSFTGTGATQVINCGFTGGARFVLIKATSTTGNWLVWDTARGIIPSNDPYLALNSTAAEVTNTDWVDTAATGFELSNANNNLANSNGVSYIYLAIA